MADKKFTQLTAAGVLAAADLLAISQSPFGAGTSKSITGTNLLTFVGTTFLKLTGGTINEGAQSLGPGTALKIQGAFDDGGAGSETFSMVTLKMDTSSGNFSDAYALTLVDVADALKLYISFNGYIWASQLFLTSDFQCGNGAVTLTNSAVGFFSATPQPKQTSGANLTNSVTAGGTDDTIANFTSLTVYATDAAAIRNDIYQLARKVKQLNDGLRLYGLFT